MALSYYFDSFTDSEGYSVKELLDGSNKETSNTLVDGKSVSSLTYNFDFYVATDAADENLETFELELDFGKFFKAVDGQTTIDWRNNIQSEKFSIDNTTGNITLTGAALDEVQGLDNYKINTATKLFSVSGLSLADNFAALGDSGDLTNEFVVKTNNSQTTLATTDYAEITYSDAAAEISIQGKDGQSLETTTGQVDLLELATVLGTTRTTGSSEFTNLIRFGDTVEAVSFFQNVGNSAADLRDLNIITGTDGGERDLSVTVGSVKNFESQTDNNYALSAYDTGFGYDYGESDALALVYDVTLGDTTSDTEADVEGFDFTGKIGGDLFDLTYTGEASFSYTDDMASVSDNVITFQGDLNYDGLVSMQDLAYLNAGGYAFDDVAYDAAKLAYDADVATQAAAQDVVDGYDAENDTAEDLAGWEGTLATAIADTAASLATLNAAKTAASDVDADHNGVIDMSDLAIIDNDWEKSLHGGTNVAATLGTISLADVGFSGVDASGTAALDGDVITFVGVGTTETSIETLDASLGSDLAASFSNSDFNIADDMLASYASELLGSGDIAPPPAA